MLKPAPARAKLPPMRSLLVALLGAVLPGCGLLDFPSSDGGTSTDLAFGFGKPTLQITVGSTHFGPAAPDPGSSAQLANQRDGSGRIVQSRFTLLGSVGGATCAVAFERDGLGGIDPIGARSYLVGSGNQATTPDGTVAPTATQAVIVPQATLACSGSGCSGTGLVLTALDASHAEGYLSGVWADSLGRGSATVTCSFYLPLSVYQP